MNKYKVLVYAIAKNEEKNAREWVESMSEADEIYVLDTGSTDGTVEILKSLGVHVQIGQLDPFRFDVARNNSLSMLPDDVDICVCTDIDERFHKGWRASVEKVWNPDVCQVKYRYTWSFAADGSEGCVFWISKIHARSGFEWVHPVHEVLRYVGEKPFIEAEAPGVQLDHHADSTKSRSQYLPLLELSVAENPEDDRNMHYLGREYMFHGMWAQCRETLKKHLQLKTSTWSEERCASMRYLTRACGMLQLEDEEQQWAFRAIAEAPHMREPWLEACKVASKKKEWTGALYFAEKALAITERSKTYINEAECWSEKPYDLAALAAYYAGLYEKSYEYGEKALEIDPDNARLLKNFQYYEQAVLKNHQN